MSDKWTKEGHQKAVEETQRRIRKYVEKAPVQKLPEPKNALEQFQWIPVETKLPEYGENVLTYSADGEVFVDYLKTTDKFTSDYPEAVSYPVTHWMPLPTPPGESQEEGNE